MIERKMAVLLSAVMLLAALMAMPAWAQSETREGREGRGGRERGNVDPEQMRQWMEEARQRQAERMKERLGVTDEEWTLLQPRVERVVTLQARSQGGRALGMLGGGQGFRGRDGGEGTRPAAQEGQSAGREQPEVAVRSRELAELLRQEEAKPEQIQAALEALRAARKKQEEELAQAREELRELLTLRQEATLVTLGVLE